MLINVKQLGDITGFINPDRIDCVVDFGINGTAIYLSGLDRPFKTAEKIDHFINRLTAAGVKVAKSTVAPPDYTE